MKKYSTFFLQIILLISCKSNSYTNIEVNKENKNYRVFFVNQKDSTEIIIPFIFKIRNNTNNELELNPIKPKRKVTFFSEQHIINSANERKGFLFKKIKSNDSLSVLVFGSKKIHKKDLNFIIQKEELLEHYDKTLTIETKEDLEFKKTTMYKSIVKSIEKDSIFFLFINRDKNIHFYKVGTIKGKTFFTDDKSNK